MPKDVTSPLMGLVKEAKAIASELGRFAGPCTALATSPETEAIEAVPALKGLARDLRAATQAAESALKEALEKLEERLEKDADSYPARVGAALKQAGYEPLGDPTRPIVAGKVYLELDPTRPEVRLNDRVLAAVHPASVAMEVTKALEKLGRLMTPPAEFLRELEQAYSEELKATGGSPNAQVKVADVHFRIMLARQSKAFRRDPKGSVFREYPLELFRADLYAALIGGPFAGAGRALCIASGSDTNGAVFMLIPALGRPGYAGRLWFERAGS